MFRAGLCRLFDFCFTFSPFPGFTVSRKWRKSNKITNVGTLQIKPVLLTFLPQPPRAEPVGLILLWDSLVLQSLWGAEGAQACLTKGNEGGGQEVSTKGETWTLSPRDYLSQLWPSHAHPASCHSTGPQGSLKEGVTSSYPEELAESSVPCNQSQP